MKVTHMLGIGLAGILGFMALDWIVEGHNFFLYKFWAPKFEDVRRETYTHTQSYRKGSADRLATLCGQLRTASTSDKVMINDQIAHEFSDLNTSDVPDYLQGCLATARGQ